MPLVRRVIPAPGGEGTGSHTVPPIPAVGCHRMAALKALCLMALMAYALAMGTSAHGAVPDWGASGTADGCRASGHASLCSGSYLDSRAAAFGLASLWCFPRSFCVMALAYPRRAASLHCSGLSQAPARYTWPSPAYR